MNIALIANLEKDLGLKISSDIAQYLKSKGAVVYADLSIDGAITGEKSEIIQLCDVFITVGGDGTILKVVKDAYLFDKPILAVNLGKIGYMASMEPSEYSKFDLLISGNYKYQYRSALSVSVRNSELNIFENVIAMNDAVISHGNWTQIMNIDLLCNDKFITSYRADGLIFATPTGSTAYSLSAGGPIIDTELEIIEVTPICAHSFNGRSILFKDTSVLEAISATGHGSGAYLTIDGLENYKLDTDDIVTVKLAEKKIRTITFDDDSFYNILSKKIK